MTEQAVPAPKPVTFPYKNLDAAVKDGFKKIGGPDQAFRFLQKGYKEVHWRRKANANAREAEKAQDAAVTKS